MDNTATLDEESGYEVWGGEKRYSAMERLEGPTLSLCDQMTRKKWILQINLMDKIVNNIFVSASKLM